MIPELRDIIGPQPKLEDVSPAEARARFQTAVRKLAAAMATADNPLVLFLDDLQWADLPSIDLITNLATDPDSENVLLLGAYRENEVDESHPLNDAIARMREVGAALEQIELGPLEEDAVYDLVADTFAGATGRARLAALCREKTRGNAFFLRRFLESLYDDGAVRLDTQSGRWQFDLPQIEARAMSEEVVDFVLSELRKLPAPSLEALRVASVIGNRFDLAILAAALGIEVSGVLERLRPALDRAPTIRFNMPFMMLLRGLLLGRSQSGGPRLSAATRESQTTWRSPRSAWSGNRVLVRRELRAGVDVPGGRGMAVVFRHVQRREPSGERDAGQRLGSGPALDRIEVLPTVDLYEQHGLGCLEVGDVQATCEIRVGEARGPCVVRAAEVTSRPKKPRAPPRWPSGAWPDSWQPSRGDGSPSESSSGSRRHAPA